MAMDDGDNEMDEESFFMSEELGGRLDTPGIDPMKYANMLSLIVAYEDRPFIAQLLSFRHIDDMVEVSADVPVAEALKEVRILSSSDENRVQLLEIHLGDDVQYSRTDLRVIEYGFSEPKGERVRFTLCLHTIRTGE